MPISTPALDLILNLADKSAAGRLALSGSRVVSSPSAGSASYRIVRADNGVASVRACLPNLSGERAFDDVDLSTATVRIALGLPGTNPFCLATLDTPLPPAAAILASPQSATADLPATKRITLDPAPYAGSFIVTVDALDPFEIPFDAEAAQVRSLLPADTYKVAKRAANAWEISGTEPNQDITIAVDVTGLSVPLGLSGPIALNTQGLADYFTAQGNPKFVRLTLEVDIDGVKVYQNDQVEIARELINLSTLVPTPLPPSDVATINTALAGKQPISAQLTAIAALTGTAFGRALLTKADGPAVLAYLSAQPLSAQLSFLAALVTAAYGRNLLTASSAPAARALLLLDNVDNTADADKPISAAAQTALDLKAPDAATVHLTGDEAIDGVKSFSSAPIAPTPVNATSNTQLATTAFVHALIADLLNAPPSTLDTLKELADALGDDPNFATTVATSIANRLAKASNLSDLTDFPAARGNLGLGNVNNTSDANKPVSTAQAAADTSVANAAAAALTAAVEALLAADNTFAGQNIFPLLQTFNAIASSSVVAAQLANPVAPTVTPIGNDEGATWSYKIVAKLSDGATSAAGPAGTTTHGDQTLDATNKNSLAWTAVPGAVSYDVYRTAHGVSPSTTGKIANVATNSYVDTGAAGDGSLPPLTNVTGRVSGFVHDKGGQFFNVRAFGALANGGDDTVAIQAAIDAAKAVGGVVFFPPGDYYVSTLYIDNTVTLLGVGQPADGGSQLLTGQNAHLLHITARCTIDGLSLRGSQNPAFANQDLIHVSNTNDVRVRNCFLALGYHNLRFDETCHGIIVANTIFGNSVKAALRTTGTREAGCELVLNCSQVRGGLAGDPAYNSDYMMLFENLGALSVANCKLLHSQVAVAGVCINTVASKFGSVHWSGSSTIECEGLAGAPALQLLGTAERPIKNCHFANINLGGGNQAGSHIVELGFVQAVHFTDPFVLGNGHGFYFKNQSQGCRITNPTFSLASGNYPLIGDVYRLTSDDVAALGTDKMVDDLIVTGPKIMGTPDRALMYFHAGSPLLLGNIDVIGGTIGLVSDLQLDRPAYATGKRIRIDTPDYHKGPLTAIIPPDSVPLTSGVEVRNDTDVNVMVTLEAFSNLSVTINDAGITGAVVVPGGAGTYFLPVGGKIRLNFSGSPGTWYWTGM